MSETRPNFDWTRNPPPAVLTPFQRFTRDVDWEKSPLGPMDTWPNQLRQMVLLVMADPNPAVVYWGVEQAIVYNEAYVPLIGQKHPGLQGQNPRFGGFAEIWDHFDHVLKEGERTGETHVAARSMLTLYRYGYFEETYFSWKFVPIVGEEGYVVASYATVVENTREVLNDRRRMYVQHASNNIPKVGDLDQFWPNFLASLDGIDQDIPLALAYSVKDGDQCTLHGTFGLPQDHPDTPPQLRLDDNNHHLAALLQKGLKASTPLLVRVEDGSFPVELFQGVSWRGFGVPSTEYVICPIRAGELITILVLALNPRRPYDGDYQQFVDLMIAQLISPHFYNIALTTGIAARKARAELAQQEQAILSRQLRAKTIEFEESMKFTRFADRAPMGLSVADSSGSIMYGNKAWSEFTGLDPNTAGKSSWLNSVVDEDQPMILDWWHKLTIEGKNVKFQTRTKQPFEAVSEDGALMMSDHKTGICVCYADHDQEGNIETVMSVIMDVSELVWVQDNLRQRTVELESSELKYRLFAEHAPVGVCRFDKNGLIEFANQAWNTIFKQQQNNENGVPWIESIHLDDLAEFKSFLSNIKTLKAPKTMECRLKRTYTAFDQLGAVQPQAWILASGYAELGSDGNIISIICWVTEISAQKAAVSLLTNKMEQVMSMKRQQENFMDMMSHEIRNPMSAILHSAEEISHLSSELSPDNIKCLDETSQKRLVSIAEAAQTITYCVSHQRRLVDDVLTLSKLDSDLINVRPVPVQPAELTKQALLMFEHELKKADIELKIDICSSIQDLDMEWISLDPNRFTQLLINLVTNAIKFTRSQEERSIHIKVSVARDKPSDNPGLIEYLPRRASDLCISKLEEAAYLLVQVRDTGIGMQEHEKKALFREFAQASPKTYIRYGGTGLGLFISRQLTEIMGGEIGVASQPGSGSTFAFFVRALAVKNPDRRMSIEQIQDTTVKELVKIASTNGALENKPSKVILPLRKIPEKPTGEHRPLRVLVLEDNLINQRVLCKQLRNRGHTVESANHGGEGLAALESSKSKPSSSTSGPPHQYFDIVLCDIEMPVMNGLDFVRRVRELETQGELEGHVPIIAVTANARTEQVNHALNAGMDGVTTKPYHMAELIAEMSRLVAKPNQT